MVPVANRSGLREALESTSGTVTNFLEQLVGESIDAEAHHQDIIGAPTSNHLGVAPGEPLLQRAATLRGRRTGFSYVYAESIIVTSRLPTKFGLRLESSIDPIGRILDEMGIAVTRKNLVEPDGSVVCRPNGAMKLGDYLLARTYRIDSGQTPLMVITEWFLRTLNPFLSPAAGFPQGR
jgi:chorismate-pyruvate lyase